MKGLLTIAALLLITTLFSCKKESSDQAVLTGKWRLVSDSSYGANVGYEGTSGAGAYHGTTADYFDFGTNGMVISHEKGGVDTAHYSLADNKVQFFYDQAGNPGRYYYMGGALSISNFTAHSLTLTSAEQTPAGYFSREIKLSR